MNQNFSAFLSMIAACEGADYNVLFGGSTFEPGDDHPRKIISAGGYQSSAAGRYQILAKTWDSFIAARGKHRFDQQGQDACALWLIERRGAMFDVQTGRLQAAIKKCGKEWASLPGAPYGQKTRSMQYCIDKYTAAGGKIEAETQPPAPIEDRSTQLPEQPTLNPLLLIPSLLEVFKPLVAAKLGKALDNKEVGDGLANKLLSFAQEATGKDDPLQAVAAVRADPAVAAKVEQAAVDHLAQIQPAIEMMHRIEMENRRQDVVGRDAAKARAVGDTFDVAPVMVKDVTANTRLSLLGVLGGIVAAAIAKGVYPDLPDYATALIPVASFMIGQLQKERGAIIAYRFDGTPSSNSASALNAEIVARRPNTGA